MPGCSCRLPKPLGPTIIIYDFTQRAADTLNSLGTKFVLGCIAIAAAIVLAKAKSKRLA